MSHDLIAQRLKEAMGLHAPTVGMMTVSSAINRRMRECEIDTDKQYLSLIISSSEEMKELIETVLIPETWFFRENQPYKYILEYFKDKHSKVNILSIPCSTGEEPYSIAMMLMDNNINVDAFSIDAVDIGENNIAKAKKGLYRKNSFRADDLSFVDKYFHKQDNLFNLAGFVKNKVNFHCDNVLSDSFDLGENHYDIVFCRNLLIYFDAETQLKMFLTINKILKPKGLLVLGHAETIQYSKDLFVPAINSRSYVYVKKTNLEKSLPHLQKTRRNNLSQSFSTSESERTLIRPFSETRKQENNYTKEEPIQSTINTESLEVAFNLADEGKLEDALRICNTFIKNHTDSSKAYYLTGIIYDTKGDVDKADESLHKAIYLDPKNIEALIHLSLIAEQRGNHEEATRFRQRAQRVHERHSA